MTRRSPALLLVAAGGALAAAAARPAAAAPERPPAAADVAREVDALLEAAWRAAGVEPAAPASDAEWLRRVHLDVEGVIPEPSVVAAFLARGDDAPGPRRAAHLRGLLYGQGWARSLATRLGNALVGRERVLAEADRPEALATWLGAQVAGNVPFDQLVRTLLDPPAGSGAAAYRARYGGQLEELAGNALLVLQGVRLHCAQCHDHPYRPAWTQVRFWETAALFGDGGEVRVPGAGMGRAGPAVTPRLALTDATPPPGVPPRAAVGRLLTAPDNPYFARALVERVWALFFGAGLLAEDDPLVARALPEVVDRLAADVVAAGYDLRRLAEVVASTRAYGLSSAGPAGPRLAQEALFARARVRTLAPEALWASLARAGGLEDATGPAGARAAEGSPAAARRDRVLALRREFFGTFARGGGDEAHAITEALALINGPLTNAALRQGDGAAAFAEVLRLPPGEQVAALFLRGLSRPPTRSEAEALRAAGGASSDQRAALLQDVAWALLNSSEFATNH